MANKKRPPATNDKVGYGNPPKSTQFKKGRSGNPTGRPNGSRSALSVFQKALDQRVVVNEGDKQRSIRKVEAAAIQFANKLAQGDIKSLQLFLKIAPHIEKSFAAQALASPVAFDPEKLKGISDEDLRTMLEILEKPPCSESDKKKPI